MKYKELQKELSKWKDENIISKEQYDILVEKYNPHEENEPRVYTKIPPKKTLIFFTLIIVVLGTLSWIGQVVPGINNVTVFFSLIFLAIGALYFGDYLADRKLKVIKYVGKTIMLIGCLITSFIILYADIKANNMFGVKLLGADWSLFMLVSGAILFYIAYKMREKVVLIYSLVLFLLWFVVEGKIASKSYAGVWLGMTLPTRLFLFSLLFVILGIIHEYKFEWLGNAKLNQRYKIFDRTYYTLGLLIMFIPVWVASMGGWLAQPALPIRLEVLFFTLLAIGIAIYSIYLGLVKSNKLLFNLGMIFFILEVYGKFYEVLVNKLNTPIYYILIVLLGIGIAVLIEYVVRHKEQLRQELLRQGKN